MEEKWTFIKDFPDYLISTYGEVVNEASQRVIHTSRTQSGLHKIGLYRGGTQHTRSIKVLVAQTFVDGESDVFDTPIHLDNDQDNFRADNLVWRPRWFAWKYKKQFEKSDRYRCPSLYFDLETNLQYETIFEIAITHGLLMTQVEASIINRGFGDLVFPTWQSFGRVDDYNI